jgi:hypothetical protein
VESEAGGRGWEALLVVRAGEARNRAGLRCARQGGAAPGYIKKKIRARRQQMGGTRDDRRESTVRSPDRPLLLCGLWLQPQERYGPMHPHKTEDAGRVPRVVSQPDHCNPKACRAPLDEFSSKHGVACFRWLLKDEIALQ